MSKPKGRIYMPHPGHFIGAMNCRFRINTYVPTGFIVSTVGEYMGLTEYKLSNGETFFDSWEVGQPFEQIGLERLFETMVFRAKKTKAECCPYEADVKRQVDFEGYNTAGDAVRGHEAMCLKWEKRKK